MRIIAHIHFNGDCEAAFKLYEECFGGKIAAMLHYGSTPTPPADPAFKDKIAHATLKVGDQTLTGVDVASGVYEPPRGFAVQLNIDDPREAQRVFDALAKGAVVHMLLQKTFWTEHYAVLTDRFGVPWEINCA